MIIKRSKSSTDSNKVEEPEIAIFNKTKIRQAVTKAMKNGSGILLPDIARLIANDAEKHFKKQKQDPTVYQVEKYVFDRLLHYGQVQTARAYEGFRAVQEYKRQREADPLIKSIRGLISQDNEEVMTENSNKQPTLVPTQRDLAAGEVSKIIAKEIMIPPHLVQANDDGIIKIHDLDYFMNPLTNCELVNLKDMFENETVINNKLIRTPKSIQTAMTVATQIAAQVASSTYGGQTMSLTHLAPYVRVSRDKITTDKIKEYKELGVYDLIDKATFDKIVHQDLLKEVSKAVQTFNYQINTLQTTNGQTPFISLVMYLGEDKEYTEEVAILIEEFLKQRIEGMENEFGVKTTQTFPKLLYFLDEDNITDKSKYSYLTELAAQSVAKRLSPDFISVKKMMEVYGHAYGPMGRVTAHVKSCELLSA